MRATRYLLLFALTAVLAFTQALDAQNKDKDKDKDKDKENKAGEVSGKRLVPTSACSMRPASSSRNRPAVEHRARWTVPTSSRTHLTTSRVS